MENQETTKMPPALPEENKALPGFVKGFVITDLVFCSLRIIITLLGCAGLVGVGKDSPLFYPYMFEVLFNFMIVMFGVSGNIMILSKKPIGIKFAQMNIIVTIGSVLVGGWQVFAKFTNNDTPSLIGTIIGFSVVVIMRCVLLGFYCSAIAKAKVFFSKTNPE